MLTGENGILTQATNARDKTDKATEEEKIQMAVLGSSVDNNGYVDILDETSFKNELANQFGNQSLDIVANGDGSFIITVEDTERKYYVNDDKTVINSDNIIEISTAEELASFRDDVNSGNTYEGKAVLLTSDITLDSSIEWEPIGYYDQASDEKNPDTAINKPFRGIFDGGNYTINGINITTKKNGQGLFGFTVNSSIRNIVIGKSCKIYGNKQTAGIVGYLYGENGNISNCINKADIDGNAGIVGKMVGKHTIFNCKNYGNINGDGGILGSGTNGQIVQSGNYGNIIKENEYYCGGIVGYFNGEIINCCNKAKIISNSSFVGGIAGHTTGNVKNCYNINNVEGTYCIGGIIGWVSEAKNNVSNCYFFGEIIGLNIENILIGDGIENSDVINCYTKEDTFTAVNLGSAFKDNPENLNQPLLYWE